MHGKLARGAHYVAGEIELNRARMWKSNWCRTGRMIPQRTVGSSLFRALTDRAMDFFENFP
jgi:hypothetical protein